jgi:hypothetical protein
MLAHDIPTVLAIQLTSNNNCVHSHVKYYRTTELAACTRSGFVLYPFQNWLFFRLFLWVEWNRGHWMPYCSSHGWWWMMMSVKQSVECLEGGTEVLGGVTCPSVALSTTNPTWPDLDTNPGRRGGKAMINRLSYGTANLNLNSMVWVRQRTIPTERQLLVGEVIANFCG